VPTTHGRSRGRQGVHSGARGATGDHTRVIMPTMVATAVIVIFVLVMTTAGRTIDAATQHFMLFYAGVFALVGLTGSVLVGLIATDRIIMTPGHRVMAQAVHRAMSFGALTFLVIHIVTEILAQRVHVIDAFIPFLSPFRTFYIGLGTIASDLIILIVVTSILRKRFTAHGKAWRWRAIHYSSYVAFVLGVLHGLLGGRAAKPYVDWSYGVAIALTALGLAVRFLAISLRPKEKAGAAPGADRAGSTSSASLQAAALSLAQAQLGGPVQVLPAGMGIGSGTTGMRNSDSWPALPVASGWSSSSSGWSSSSGPIPALGVGPAYAAADASTGADLSYPAAPSAGPYRSPDSYRELGFAPLGAPPYGDDGAALRGRPYVAMNPPMQAQAGPSGATAPGSVARQPLYEPEYDGPPRFAGAPRGHVPQDELSSYPYGVSGNRPSDAGYPDREEPAGRSRPRHQRTIEPPGPGPANPGQTGQGQGDRNTGSIPRAGSGPMPRAGTGPIPRVGMGQLPRGGTGPMPGAGSGPMPRADSGPMPRAGTGPMPGAGSGPMPRADSGPMPRAGTGPMPRDDSGPMPRAGTGPMPRQDTGRAPRIGNGQLPRADSGPMPRVGTGAMPRPEAGPAPRSDTGSIPRAGGGQRSRAGAGPVPHAERGQGPRAGTGSGPGGATAPRLGAGRGPVARPDTGPIPRIGPGPAAPMGLGPAVRSDTGPTQPAGTGAMPWAAAPTPPADPAPAPRGGPAAGRRSRRTDSADLGYREVSRPTGSDEWR
jgi:DMSO/TMAO reductase YedYZ heme-binding membrane subunit